MLPGIMQASRIVGADGRGGGGSGGVSSSSNRQVAMVSPLAGQLIYLNSGSAVRQRDLPGVAVNEGT